MPKSFKLRGKNNYFSLCRNGKLCHIVVHVFRSKQHPDYLLGLKTKKKTENSFIYFPFNQEVF